MRKILECTPGIEVRLLFLEPQLWLTPLGLLAALSLLAPLFLCSSPAPSGVSVGRPRGLARALTSAGQALCPPLIPKQPQTRAGLRSVALLAEHKPDCIWALEPQLCTGCSLRGNKQLSNTLNYFGSTCSHIINVPIKVIIITMKAGPPRSHLTTLVLTHLSYSTALQNNSNNNNQHIHFLKDSLHFRFSTLMQATCLPHQQDP